MPSADSVLAEHRRRAEQRLAAVAGDITLCVIGRSGESFPGVKYHEGAVAALMEVQRKANGGSFGTALTDVTAA